MSGAAAPSHTSASASPSNAGSSPAGSTSSRRTEAPSAPARAATASPSSPAPATTTAAPASRPSRSTYAGAVPLRRDRSARRISRSRRTTPRRPTLSSSAYRPRIWAKISLATCCCCSRRRVLDPVEDDRIAVADGHLRELEPLPVAHLGGAVDRHRHDRRAGHQRQPPDPALGLLGQLAGARAPALAVHRHRAATLEDPGRRDERVLVLVAAPHREHAAVRVDPLERAREQLRLGHEPHLAPDRDAEEEVVHEREVVRRQDDRPRAGHLVRRQAARAEEHPRVQRREDADGLVDPVRLARPRALVEAVEVLLRARVLVDLRLHPGEVLLRFGRLLLGHLRIDPTRAHPSPIPASARARGASRRAASRARPRTSRARSAPARRRSAGPGRA